MVAKVTITPVLLRLEPHERCFSALSRPAPASPFNSLLVDIQELALMLDRSAVSLARDEAAGRLPGSVRIGRSKKWRRLDIERWIELGCPSRREFEAHAKSRK
jgi:predicted DNA-binding transcriptional regulator AlpA